MAYKEQLRQAREILQSEITELQTSLARKESDLRKLNGLLKETGSRRAGQPSLTSQIVEALYVLVQKAPDGVPARAVVQEFVRQNDDVNESTIRSTLYQVTRKMSPTEIMADNETKNVRVLKNGSLYSVELVSEEASQIV